MAKRWRLGLDLGGVSPQSEIESDAANILSLFSPDGEIVLFNTGTGLKYAECFL